MCESAPMFLTIEKQARRIAAELLDVPPLERSEWLQVKIKNYVQHLVGIDRVTVAFFLGMHVGNHLTELEQARGLARSPS